MFRITLNWKVETYLNTNDTFITMTCCG
uniref:Uncharacterized protein n=1 Tax=Rhizophora mucronata TaxID=61149 RepID=A0A2P2R1I6_RHIMU